MPAGVSAWTPLANITLANSTTTSVTFGSISSAYRDLVIVYQGTTQSPSGNRYWINNDQVNSTYFLIDGFGTGSSVFSQNVQSPQIGYDINSTTTQNNVIVQIFDYAQTNKHKTILARANNTSAGVEMQAKRWANTAAVTSVVINNAAIWNAGTTICLYGVSS
jgi:hypothetical protein